MNLYTTQTFFLVYAARSPHFMPARSFIDLACNPKTAKLIFRPLVNYKSFSLLVECCTIDNSEKAGIACGGVEEAVGDACPLPPSALRRAVTPRCAVL